MQLHLVFVGKTVFPEIDEGIRRYLDRLSHYASVTAHIVKPERITKSVSDDAVRAREGDRILNLVGKEGFLVVWDQRGKEMDSPGFARFLGGLRDREASRVWMVVGGPVGLSQKLLDRAGAVLSLSRMTFPHDLARLMILEQLYRAFTILKGEPYHK